MSNTSKRLHTLALTAISAALYIVLDRYLAIVPSTANTSVKVTFAVIPLLLCGYLCGPICGGACGLLADLIGAFLSAFAPNPLLTVKPILLGVIPGLLVLLYRKKTLPFDPCKPLAVVITVVVSEALLSGLWQTWCLARMFGTPFAVKFVARLPVVLISMVIDAAGASLLLKSKEIRRFGRP